MNESLFMLGSPPSFSIKRLSVTVWSLSMMVRFLNIPCDGREESVYVLIITCLSFARGGLDNSFCVLLLAWPSLGWRSLVCYVYVLFLARLSLVWWGLVLLDSSELKDSRYVIQHQASSGWVFLFIYVTILSARGLRMFINMSVILFRRFFLCRRLAQKVKFDEL